MEEANTTKYYLARYFFLAMSILQGLATALILLQLEDANKNRVAALVMFTAALVFFSLHLLLASKIKRVAVNRKKIAVKNMDKVKEYTWSDVKDLKLLPFINMYSLKLKGKRNKIYFLPTSDTSALLGIFTSDPKWIPKKAR